MSFASHLAVEKRTCVSPALASPRCCSYRYAVGDPPDSTNAMAATISGHTPSIFLELPITFEASASSSLAHSFFSGEVIIS